jgi:hypothetical protein
MFSLARSKLTEIGVLILTLLGVPGFGQSGGKPLPMPQYHDLLPEDKSRLDRQRAIVAAAAKRYGAGKLAGTRDDLPILQKMINDRVFSKSQTYELQSLGVVFGDVLANELPLRWVIVSDEFGTDPTLRYKQTMTQINALTMISKRIERDEPVDLAELLRITREQLNRIERKGH